MEIPIYKTEIPYFFNMEFDSKEYIFEIDYNLLFNHFTVSLKYNGEYLVTGEKVILNQPLFSFATDEDGNRATNFPNVDIVPFTNDTKVSRVGYNELGDSVILKIEEVVNNEGRG
ncbi:phage baseplate plug family protein [Clostridium botulinum]|uniref:phage baseplate plug family protein n=1 Tax=Clostridium botulinum TaxID=1491 RepID=UPI000773267A|nr:hypothetical protein [Clostridium botulinum]